MATISKDTFKKIFILYLLSQFKKGVYGDFRLQKEVFFLEKHCNLKPFSFKNYKLGPYSEDLARIKDLLLWSGWIAAKDVGKTVAYLPNIDDETFSRLTDILDSIFSSFDEFEKGIKTFIRVFGHSKSEALRKEAYASEEMKKTKFKEIIFEENLEDKIDVPSLSKDEIEDLELGKIS